MTFKSRMRKFLKISEDIIIPLLCILGFFGFLITFFWCLSQSSFPVLPTYVYVLLIVYVLGMIEFFYINYSLSNHENDTESFFGWKLLSVFLGFVSLLCLAPIILVGWLLYWLFYVIWQVILSIKESIPSISTWYMANSNTIGWIIAGMLGVSLYFILNIIFGKWLYKKYNERITPISKLRKMMRNKK